MLVEIARFPDPEEAWCAESLLRARGFKTFVQNENLLTVNPSLRVALGGFPIMCTADEAEAATLALRDAQMPGADEGAEDFPAQRRRTNWLWLPAAFLVAIPFIPVYRSKTGYAVQLIIVLLVLPILFFILMRIGSGET